MCTAGLLAGSMMAVTVLWWSAADSPLVALSLALALSTTLAMHFRLALGRAIAAVHIMICADIDACQTLVRDTIERLRAEGALAQAGFAPRDLGRVEAALTRSLQAMYHHRPTYPSTPGLVPPRAAAPLVRRFWRARS